MKLNILTLLIFPKNVAANMLANVASKLTPINDGFTIELLFIPSFLDNVTN